MSAIQGTGVLALWIDVAPSLESETDDWYVDEHLPERIDIGGYLRARRYGALQGSPGYLSLFEASTPEALASEGYLSLVGRISEQSQRIRAGFSNVVRNTFRVRATAGRGIGAVMASYRLRPAAGRAQAAPAEALAALDALAPQLLRQRDVVGAHWLQGAPDVRARMDAVRAVGRDDAAAGHVLLVETTREATARHLRDAVLSDTALAALGWQVENLAVYGLLYEVSGRPGGAEITLGDRI